MFSVIISLTMLISKSAIILLFSSVLALFSELQTKEEIRLFQGEGEIALRYIFLTFLSSLSFPISALTIMCDGISFSFL
jgi:hypothetical protein